MIFFKPAVDPSGGDTKAFEVLFQLFYERVYKASYMILKDVTLAEDAAQEAFLKAFKRLDTLKEPKKFGPWVESIATRCAIDILRERKAMVFVEEMSEEMRGDYKITSAPSLPDDELESRELNDRLKKAMDALSPIYRRVIVLKFFLSYDNDQIADALKIPVGTVKSRLNRAIQVLKRKITNHRDLREVLSPGTIFTNKEGTDDATR